MISREEEARTALTDLTYERFIAFLRAIRSDASCLAVEIINHELDEGKTIDQIFFTGNEFGFVLDAERTAPLAYRIHFGCNAGPCAGDGGSWDVVYQDEAQVVSVAGRIAWIS